MATKTQTISPTGRLNWDDSLEVIPSGDCRERWHVEMSETGQYGKITNMRGDVAWDLNLAATEHVIGACYDTKRQQTIYIISNTSALTTGRILSVVETGSDPFYLVTELYEYNNFFENFTTAILATDTYVDCKMLDDILLTVDGVNENKAIDIVKCKKVNDGTIKAANITSIIVDSTGLYPSYVQYGMFSTSNFNIGDTVYIVLDNPNYNILYGGVSTVGTKINGVYYRAILCDLDRDIEDINITTTGKAYVFSESDDFYHSSDDSVSMIVPTPRYAPEVSCVYDIALEDTSIDSNFGVYQFATSYVYYNDSESLLSPFSEETANMAQPLIDETGEYINTIKVTINIDRYNIKKIRLYARRILEAVSNFYLIEEFDREDVVGNIIEYDFLGKATSISTDIVDALTIQDSIPYTSETIDIVKNNVIVLGGNTEGYNIEKNNLEAAYTIDDEVDVYTQIGSDLTYTQSGGGTNIIYGESNGRVTSITLTGLSTSNTDKGYLMWSMYYRDPLWCFNLFKQWGEGYISVAYGSFSPSANPSRIPLDSVGGSGLIGTLYMDNTVTTRHSTGIIRTSIAVPTIYEITNTGTPESFKLHLYGIKKGIDYWIESALNFAETKEIDVYVPILDNTDSSLAERIVAEINNATFEDVASVTIGNAISVNLPPDGTTIGIGIGVYEKEKPYILGGFNDDSTRYLIQNYYDKYGRLKYISDQKKVTIPYLIQTDEIINYGIDNTAIDITIQDSFDSDVDTFSFSISKPKKNWKQFAVRPGNVWDATEANTAMSYDADSTKTGLYAIAIDDYAVKNGLSSYTFTAGDSIRIAAYYDSSKSAVGGSKTFYTTVRYKDIIKSSIISNNGTTIIFVDSAMIANFTERASQTDMEGVTSSDETIDSGTLIAGAVYEVTKLDDVRHFGYNVKLGDFFIANGTETATANDTVKLVCYYVFEVYGNYGEISDEIQFFECSTRYNVSDYAVGSHIKLYNGEAFVKKNLDTYNTGLRLKSLKLYPNATVDTRNWGKVIARDENPSIKYYNSVRNGGKSFQNTAINNLFRFNYDDVIYLNDNYGTIKGMIVRGNTIRVYQERHNASIYIGGTEIANQDGTTQIIRSDKVLGSHRYSENNNYGLQIKTAIVDTGNNIYLWDLINGVIVRDNNGMMPIVGRVVIGESANDFKMERFFKDATKKVSLFNSFKVSLGYNKDNRVVFVTNQYDTNYPTIAFSEEHGFWYQFVDMNPKFYVCSWLDTVYIKNSNDVLYKMYDDVVSRCYITGEQKPFIFEITANDNGKLQKTYEALSLTSSEAIGCEIVIPPSPSYRFLISGTYYGMKSRIKKGRYRLEENIYRAEILRNMLPDNDVSKLYNGDMMRGSVATFTFTETDSDEPIEILAADVYYSDSSQ